DHVGSVSFGLKLSMTVEITRVDYQISGNGIPPILGRIDLTTTPTARALVSGIPVGMSYVLDLSAYSTDMKTACMGSTMFNIVEGAAAMANVVLQCRPYSAPPPDAGMDARTDGPKDVAPGSGGSAGTAGAVGTGG